MNGILETTINTYNERPYSARATFGGAFVCEFKENKDSEVEVFLIPHPSVPNMDLSANNMQVFKIDEDFATALGSAEDVTKSAFDVNVERVNGSAVTAYDTGIFLSQMMYMSDKPLFGLAGNMDDESFDIDCDGGDDAGTYIYVSCRGEGTQLLWTSETYPNMVAKLKGAAFA